MGNDNDIVKFDAVFKVQWDDLGVYIHCPNCARLHQVGGAMKLSDYYFHYDYKNTYVNPDGSSFQQVSRQIGRGMICRRCNYIAIIHERHVDDDGLVHGEFVEYRCI